MATRAKSTSNTHRQGDDRFTDFARRLIQVPHSEIKEKLDAERKMKQTSRDTIRPANGLP